jgi:hypothetical protein
VDRISELSMANTAKYQSQPQQQQLTGDLTRKEIVEVLQELHFGGDDVLRAIAVDRNVRDCLVSALQRPGSRF